jgi:hypothetical protein
MSGQGERFTLINQDHKTCRSHDLLRQVDSPICLYGKWWKVESVKLYDVKGEIRGTIVLVATGELYDPTYTD